MLAAIALQCIMNWHIIGNKGHSSLMASQPQKYSKGLLIALLLALLLLPAAAQEDYCVIVQAGFATKCTICEQASSFKNCRVSILGQSGFNANQSQCFSICCNSSNSNANALRLCTNTYLNATGYSSDSSSGHSLGVAEVFIVVCVTVPIAFCICLLISRYLRKRRQREQSDQSPPETAVNLEAYDINSFGPYFLDNKQACSICLEANCNIITRCGHIYHALCLALWINKTRKCPLCISRDFNPTLKYCHICHRPVSMIVLQPLSNSSNRGQDCADAKCLGCQSDQQQIVIQSSQNLEKEGNASLELNKQIHQSAEQIRAQ